MTTPRAMRRYRAPLAWMGQVFIALLLFGGRTYGVVHQAGANYLRPSEAGRRECAGSSRLSICRTTVRLQVHGVKTAARGFSIPARGSMVGVAFLQRVAAAC